TRCVRPAGLIGFGIIEHNLAAVWASGTTRSAPAAWRVLINRNQITDSQVVYIGADLNDFSAELVSKDDARLRRVSRRNIQNVQVGSTDPNCLYFQNDVIGCFHVRNSTVFEFERSLAFENYTPPCLGHA